MKRRRIAIGLIFILIILVLVIPQKTEVEKEIEYYKDNGYNVGSMTVIAFYDLIPAELQTREVEVTKDTLRRRINQAAVIIGKDNVAVCYNAEKTMIWALCVRPTSDIDGYIHVLFWEP